MAEPGHPPWARGRQPPWRGRPPPWWPEGEPFPHHRGGPPRFVRRLVALGALGFLLFTVVSSFLASGGMPFWEGDDERPPWFVPIVPVAIIGAVVVGRAIRRTTMPLVEVMEAADRVAEGDYAVRVAPRGAYEVRRLADSFNAMTERLATGDRLRRDLLADVAHELRTPLSVVQGNVEGMVDGVYQPDPEHLGVVLDGTRAIARLLDDLFTLSTAEAGALRLHREPLDAERVVRDVVAAFAAQAAQAAVALTADVAPGLPAVEADATRLDQVLANLVRNALQHTPAGGHVEVAATRGPDGGVRFTVADSGAGIAQEQLASVFERYVRSDASSGAGLGLAIARRLVEAHGGTIDAASTPGAGTTITVELPAR